MDYQKLGAIGTIMIAFLTSLIGLITLIYYLYSMNIDLLRVIIGAIIYIDVILIFLYIIKRQPK